MKTLALALMLVLLTVAYPQARGALLAPENQGVVNTLTTVVKVGDQELTISMVASPILVLKNEPIVTINQDTRQRVVLADNFSGVVRFLNYDIKPLKKGKLPKDFRVREEVSVLEVNYSGLPGSRTKTVQVVDGKFSDIMAIGVSAGPALPDDLRQVVVQRLFLKDVQIVAYRISIMPGRGVIDIELLN